MCTILYSCPGNFYPRSPCGERLAKQLDRSPPLTFLSTLSLRRATVGASQGVNIEHISIHALLAESDGTGFFVLDERHDISIHALLAESDQASFGVVLGQQIFLSTLSLRRATSPGKSSNCGKIYFYPRSPCGERLGAPEGADTGHNFYPRSPCGERLIIFRA